MTRYLLIAIDMLANVAIGGQIGMTISSRCYLAARRGETWAILLERALHIIQFNHCQLALHGDLDRAKAIIEVLSPHDHR